MMLIDRRAGSKDLLAPLRRMGTECRLTTLESADVSFPGYGPDGVVRVGIEHKTLSDYLSSQSTGRWTGHQLPKMVAAYDIRYLILEGPWRPAIDHSGLVTVPMRRRGGRGFQWGVAGHGRSWLYAALVRSHLSATHKAGVHVLRAPTRSDSLYTLWALYDWWQDDWDAHTSYRGIYRKQPQVAPLVAPSVTRQVAAALPGIDWEYSAVVEAAFGSVRGMVRASVAEWAELRAPGETKQGRMRPKLGKVRAARIVATLKGE